MVILGIDYGDVRTGLAVCDKNQILATPLGCIKESYAPKLADAIGQKALQAGAELLVLGLPRNMDGTLGYRAEKCQDFAQLLQEVTGLNVVLTDERLTTVSAHRALSFDGVRPKQRKESVDSLSAVIILQSYLDQKKQAQTALKQ